MFQNPHVALPFHVLLAIALALTAHAEVDPLVGIWAYETSFGDVRSGDVTVTRNGTEWRAELAKSAAAFRVENEHVRFEIPNGIGKFRGKLIDGGRAIDGFWLRPELTEDPRYPVGSSQAFATPLVLRREGKNRWRGSVKPLASSFTLYLRIFRNEEGALLGAFRNPEQNSNGGAMQFRVARDGDAVRFTFQFAPTSPEIRLDAKVVGADRLQMSWPGLERTIELTRRTPSQAASFFPRPPNEPKYVYRKPPNVGDGWSTARARDVGIDEVALTRMVQKLIDADPSARRASLIHSLLVAYRGKLVLEEYFFGFRRDIPHDTRSAGKTFSSVMLGTAMKSGVRIGPETKLYELLRDMGPFANPDPRKSQIALSHLMTHSAGFACDDNDDASPGNEGTMQTQSAQPNWWKYTLDLPMANDPGRRYAYCSANINLVGAALTTATHTWLPEWFDRTIARPLDFGTYHWNLMPNEEGYLGGGAWLRSRDLLKLGQVFLDGGSWRGRRIVSEAWVAQSTAPHMHISPETTGLTAEEFGNNYGEADDGYAWHLGTVKVGDRTLRQYAATGNGGQVLLVIPDLDLAVVFTGGNYRQGGIWGRWAGEIVHGQIIPALRR